MNGLVRMKNSNAAVTTSALLRPLTCSSKISVLQ